MGVDQLLDRLATILPTFVELVRATSTDAN
jgi:hypothetical protein